MNKSGILLLLLSVLIALHLYAESERQNLVSPFFTPSSSFSGSQEKRTRDLCMENIIKISKAVYLYNFDSSPRITDLLNGDVCDLNGFMVRRGLKWPIHAPDKRCCYRSKGDLTDGGIIICDYHGENPDAPKMQLDGLAEAPIVDGEQIALSQKIVDLEAPLLPNRIRSAKENGNLSTQTFRLSGSSNYWRPKWTAEANNHSPSDAKLIKIRGKYYKAIQAPEMIPPESVEEHNKELLKKKLTEQGYIGFPPLIRRIFPD